MSIAEARVRESAARFSPLILQPRFLEKAYLDLEHSHPIAATPARITPGFEVQFNPAARVKNSDNTIAPYASKT